ncbi:serine protease inhibitor 42Dd-like isoform X4 [Eupeodes corollae]|uniref:serine protease inhibitor 42Dd-like isoform X4 n=1 Tax=Eupeodes corollae TaxID=290404 RepID=UPI0024935EC1|nr:serine protease inhibitor 42Dd-like isoform X4 [Eupeodes corollae]
MSKSMTLMKLFAFFLLLQLPFILSTGEMSSDLSVKFAQNSAQFSVEFYNALAALNEGKNIIFSPFSIQTCVAMAYAGATGETAEEMASGLKLVENDRALVGESFKGVLDSYANSKLLKIANKLYVQEGHEIKPEFNKIAVESFNSSSEAINFADSAPAAKSINNWVEEKTNNKIKDLISPDSLDSMTRMVLVNAIHFKGEWEKKFEKEKTAEEDFFINENDSVKVEMMNGKAKYNYGYFEELDCTAIEMPYRDSDLVMLVLLPNSRTGLKSLEEKLQTTDLHELTTQKMSVEEVVVKFPKFKVEFSAELTEPLKKLGIKKMFNNDAEFGNILDSEENLHVSKVIHKAFIEVNEEGAEAAAATGVTIAVKCAFFPMRKKVNRFIANKQFFYIIWTKNKNIIFAGKLLDNK